MNFAVETEQVTPLVAHCHCRMCQKFHGSAFSTFIEVKLQGFHLNGKAHLTHYVSDNGAKRSFCNSCGSSLFFESVYNRADQTIEVALAALDSGQHLFKPNANIYVSSQVTWLHDIHELPHFPNYRQ
ncbi:GFA family protein [Thalassotalea agarivorans]|uniref:GFA family protein n=1 Tax=Thalassotalea agarivorans TaxID=349064 RepID=UPI0015A6AAD7|nr:GFA family protein [Thalassotalea agarivorans]